MCVSFTVGLRRRREGGAGRGCVPNLKKTKEGETPITTQWASPDPLEHGEKGTTLGRREVQPSSKWKK